MKKKVDNREEYQSSEINNPKLSMSISYFIGREQYYSDISKKLQDKKIIIITGNGGIGKTQLSLEYVKRNIDKYDHVAFIDATSIDTITLDYSKNLNIINDDSTIDKKSFL